MVFPKWVWMSIVVVVVVIIWLNHYTYKQNHNTEYKIPKEISIKSIIIKPDELKFIPPSLPYTVHEFKNLLSKQECKNIRAMLLSEISPIDKEDCIITKDVPYIKDIASRLTNMPVTNMEPLEIVRFTKGGSKEHYDLNISNKKSYTYTRIATLVFYLNDEYIGGELVFPEIKTVVPELGKAILYWNVASDTVLNESLHRDKFVLRGVQWKAIQYVHSIPITTTTTTF